jgi:hypothetical protein
MVEGTSGSVYDYRPYHVFNKYANTTDGKGE